MPPYRDTYPARGCNTVERVDVEARRASTRGASKDTHAPIEPAVMSSPEARDAAHGLAKDGARDPTELAA